jgi:hypothetical protein
LRRGRIYNLNSAPQSDLGFFVKFGGTSSIVNK